LTKANDMESQDKLVGQILDDKYSIGKMLGQGGMGAVYFATHLGTGRPVALKVITPKYMANEDFVKRFKREAKAAGLLRHPNIVDVTDFGFTEVGRERLAYLVMEYLDGCTLSDVLKEEEALPAEAVVDILEQVCLAIGKAHEHGIVHRDLKPDNIWLEPDDRGGFKVKVLDFGLAKLADKAPSSASEPTGTLSAAAPASHPVDVTLVQGAPEVTQIQSPALPGQQATEVFESASSDQMTEVIHVNPTTRVDRESVDTVLSGGVTQVGAVLGTPTYMSPEQCLGEKLGAASDIYSLGVIAYEMLAGQTPFTGNMMQLMANHVQTAPQPLKEKNPDVRKGVEEVVMSALAKNPAERPATAAAFSSALRARSEGPGAILSRAFALYTGRFPLFLRISLVAYIPVLAALGLWVCGRVVDYFAPSLLMTDDLLSMALYDIGELLAWVISVGVFVPVTVQLLVAPLRPIEIRPAFATLRKRLRPFLIASLWVNLLVLVLVIFEDAALGILSGAIGESSMLHRLLESVTHSMTRTIFIEKLIAVLLIIPAAFAVKAILNSLFYGPVIALEGRSARAALARSRELVRRSRRTVVKMMALFVVVMIVETGFSIVIDAYFVQGHHPFLTSVTLGAASRIIQIILSLLLTPIVAVSLALLYFKSRQAGGETLKEILSDYQKEMLPTTEWQDRMLKRLSVRISRASNPSS
jgi:serine/threonine protein kinase